MQPSTLFRNWWVILIQGVLMILLSIIIFNNPGAVLVTVALWLGVMVMATGLFGIIAYFSAPKGAREVSTLLGGFIIALIGILMISKTIITIKAITLVFGLLVLFIGLALISGGWSSRKQRSFWWLIVLLGIGALLTGIKSIMDIYSGAESISNLIGIAVLISGIGLVCLSFLKKGIVSTIKDRMA